MNQALAFAVQNRAFPLKFEYEDHWEFVDESVIKIGVLS